MKSAEPNIGTSKRSRGEASTTTPIAEEVFVDLTAAVDPIGGVEDVDPIVVPPLSLRAMI